MVTEQVLLFTDYTMVPLGSLFNKSNVFIKLLFGGEGNTIDSLKTVIGSLT